VSSGAPQSDTPSNSSWRDPALFEAREAELVERFGEVIQRGVADDATMLEAMREMRRAAKEEPDAKVVLAQLLALRIVRRGNPMQDSADEPKSWSSLLKGE